MAKEFNAKYGKKLEMNWSLEQQKMTITRSEIKAKVIKEEKTNEKPRTKSNVGRQVNNGKKLAVSKAEISKRKPKQVKTNQVDPFADFRNM